MAKRKKLILGITGELASGKGTAVKYLIKKHKASAYKFSDPLRKIFNLLDQDINRKNFSALSTALRKIFKEDYLAKVLINKIKKDKNKIIILDGIRKKEEINTLKKIKGFKLVFINADNITRYKRLIKRNENKDDREKTFEQFLKDDKLETEKNIRSFKKLSDYEINNSGNVKELHKNIDKLCHRHITQSTQGNRVIT
jgi:dephospho-CoA kinase